jgi:hypothetical protein
VDAAVSVDVDLDRLSPEDRQAYEQFAAIECPVERAAAITAWGRPRGNLRPPFKRLRHAALLASRAMAVRDDRKLKSVARRIGISDSRFSHLTRHLATEGTS